MPTITPCLWMDEVTEEAIAFYVSLFENSRVLQKVYFNDVNAEMSGKKRGDLLAIDFELAGEKFSVINGGPFFKFTPAISLFVTCESAKEVDELWEKLSPQGQILMPLGQYPFSEQYGWLKDRFGLSWQFYLSHEGGMDQKVVPSFLFVGEQHGRAEEAIRFYEGVFSPSKVDGILHYGRDEEGTEGTVKHAQFRLLDRVFMAMESHLQHDFGFNEAISFQVVCDSQEEVDYFWEKLGAGGDPNARQCGWLKDRFGISWQVVPKMFFELIRDHESASAVKATEAMMKMKKLDIGTLEESVKQ